MPFFLQLLCFVLVEDRKIECGTVSKNLSLSKNLSIFSFKMEKVNISAFCKENMITTIKRSISRLEKAYKIPVETEGFLGDFFELWVYENPRSESPFGTI